MDIGLQSNYQVSACKTTRHRTSVVDRPFAVTDIFLGVRKSILCSDILFPKVYEKMPIFGHLIALRYNVITTHADAINCDCYAPVNFFSNFPYRMQ